MADAGSAAFRVSGLELGGLFGSLLAGRISDSLIASKPKGGNVGKRVQARQASTALVDQHRVSPSWASACRRTKAGPRLHWYSSAWLCLHNQPVHGRYVS